jgi:hypothetical protein
MNPRIRELAEQATQQVTKPDGHYIVQEWQKVFALLIVRECAGVTLDYKNHDHYTGWCDHAAEILNHFGVEQ